MEEKITLNEILELIDTDMKSAWSSLSEDDQKIVKKDFYILNRWVSSVRTNNRETAEHFVLAVNEFYNKNWFLFQKNHPELLWKSLCMCATEKKSVYTHQWIANKRVSKGNAKIMSFLEKIYPNHKIDDLELLASRMTEKEAKNLAKNYGYDDKQIKKMF